MDIVLFCTEESKTDASFYLELRINGLMTWLKKISERVKIKNQRSKGGG